MDKEFVNYLRKEEENAKMTGWDFSYIEGRYYSSDSDLPWDYASLVKKYVRSDDHILDMDTGGGEMVLSLGHDNSLISVTEGWKPNVEYCMEKLTPLGIKVYEVTDYSSMPFEDGSFHAVLNRHGSFDAEEVYRILKKGGYFITQQVGDDNDMELVKLLLPSNEKPYPGMNLAVQKKIFEDAGFETVEEGEVFAPIEFYDTGALVWFAKIIGWEFAGFSVDGCLDELMKAEEMIKRDGKVSGNIHRYMMVMKKN